MHWAIQLMAWGLSVTVALAPPPPSTHPETSNKTSAVANTEVFLIGTPHRASANLSGDSLVNVLKQIHPQVVLLELDSSFFDERGRLRSQFRDVSLEVSAVTRFAETAAVELRPFDIEGRNQFFMDNKYFERERDLYTELGTLDAAGQLSPEAHTLNEAMSALAAVRDTFELERLDVINSAACDVTIREHKEYAFKKVPRILELTPQLRKHVEFAKLADEFWTRRNDQMIQNILRCVSESPG